MPRITDRQLDRSAIRLYGKTYKQLKEAGYVWALCVDKVEQDAEIRAGKKK